MSAAQIILIALVRVYRWVLSPAKALLFGPLGRCRFSPSCSAYALEAIQEHGAVRGLWLSLRRLGRCHPWGGCGHDPVPRAGRRPAEAGLDPCHCQVFDEARTLSSKRFDRVAWTANH